MAGSSLRPRGTSTAITEWPQVVSGPRAAPSAKPLVPHSLPRPPRRWGGQCKGRGRPTQPGPECPMSPGTTQRSGAQPASPSHTPHHPSPPPGLRDWPGKNPSKEPPLRQPEAPSSPQTQGPGSVRVDAVNITVQKSQQAQNNERSSGIELGEGCGCPRARGQPLSPGRPLHGCGCRHVLPCSLGWGAEASYYIFDFKLRCWLHFFFFFYPINFQIPSTCDCI